MQRISQLDITHKLLDENDLMLNSANATRVIIHAYVVVLSKSISQLPTIKILNIMYPPSINKARAILVAVTSKEVK